MVRAGERGYLAEEFFTRGLIGIGWNEVGDLTSASTIDAIRAAYTKAYPDAKLGKIGNAVAMIYKFRSVLKLSDHVVSYDPTDREYLVGRIVGDYLFKPGEITDYSHLRKVEWLGRISRDQLSVASRNTLGSTLALFSVPPDVWSDISARLHGGPPLEKPSPEQIEEEKEGFEESKEDTKGRAHELIKDKIIGLSSDEMEKFVAALLRAMGYRTRVTPKGPDRGLDVSASPDGLGFEEPHIKAEVKHRKGQIGAPEIRSFIGGLRNGNRGLYVSTGGYTKEAKYEAERSTIPVTWLDLDALAILVVDHYEKFDIEGRTLFPLVKIYWPIE
jgi:restriction system protein